MYRATINEPRLPISWPLLLGIFGLMVIGILFIYSATMATSSLKLQSAESGASAFQSFMSTLRQDHFKQIIGYVLGLLAAAALCFVDYNQIARWSNLFFGLSMILLLFVLIFGVEINGSKRWFKLGPLNMQPSELAKIAFVFSMANFLSRPQSELTAAALFYKSLGLIAIPSLLILLEPDLGSALVFLPVGLVMMYYAGIPKKPLGIFVGGGFALVMILVLDTVYAPPKYRFVPIQEYQRHRLLVYFDRDFTADLPKDADKAEFHRLRELEDNRKYNIEQALIAVGTGGFTGKGFRQGPQNNLGFLPRSVAHNDFLFSNIAHEAGFIGSMAVLTLYALIFFSGIRIASQARDRLGQLLAVGVVALLFVHVFINIGMNIRIMPVTGIPLPLLSAGGTSAVCSLIAIGILQSVYIHRRNY